MGRCGLGVMCRPHHMLLGQSDFNKAESSSPDQTRIKTVRSTAILYELLLQPNKAVSCGKLGNRRLLEMPGSDQGQSVPTGKSGGLGCVNARLARVNGDEENSEDTQQSYSHFQRREVCLM